MDELNRSLDSLFDNDCYILSEELIKYIYDFVKADRFLDNDFLVKIFNLCVKNRKLSRYVNDFIISKEFLGLYGEYCYFENDRIVFLYKNSIIDRVCEQYKYFSKDEINMILLYVVIETILHEIEHVYQIKICNENINSLETDILKMSTIYKFNRDELEQELIKKQYCHYVDTPKLADNQLDIVTRDILYCIRPDERLADVKAQLLTLKIFDTIFHDIDFVKRHGLYYIYRILSFGYIDGGIPIKDFMEKFNRFIPYESIKEMDTNLNYLLRATYGFELDKNEYNKIHRLKRKYQK